MSETFKVFDGGWVINPATGRPVMISEAEKTSQDVRENLSIEKQSNGFGAGLEDLIGEVMDQFNFQMQATRQTRSSITALQRLQDRYLPAQRSIYERISGISLLRVQPVTGSDGKTQYSFRLSIATVAGEIVTVGGVIS
jgi:hypothetical protein